MKFCLIGSSRFKDIYDRANRELSLKGHIVYSIASVTSSAGQELPEEQKIVLDLVHLKKIEESEANVLITDETGYYGFSTRREIIWGMMLSKPLFIFVTRDPEESVIVHVGAPFGIRQAEDIPKPESVAEIIFETRKQAPSSKFGFPMPGGEA